MVERITSKIKTTVQTTYFLARIVNFLRGRFFLLRYQLSPLRHKRPVLIYQMGKVGSSSATASLHHVQPQLNLFHVHYLTQVKIHEVANQICFPNRAIAPKDHWTSRYLAKRLSSRVDNEKWKVITLVRDPVARNISAFFQNAHWLYPNLMESYAKGTLTVEELIDTFMTNYPHEIPITWFDEELKRTFSIDVYEKPYPQQAGVAFYESDLAEVAVIKLEQLEQAGVRAIQTFLNIPSFSLENTNVATKKQYAVLYEAFKESIIIPESYLDEMYNSRYTRQFYSEEEISTFRRKWSRETVSKPYREPTKAKVLTWQTT